MSEISAAEIKLYKYIAYSVSKLEKMEIKMEGNLRIDGQPWQFSKMASSGEKKPACVTKLMLYLDNIIEQGPTTDAQNL